MPETWGNVAGSPIGRLPEDVLVQIFRDVHALRDDWEECYQWYRLLWVCQAWRAIVCDFPALWNDIKVSKDFSQSYLEASLKYSKDSPIDVSIQGTTPAQNAVVIGLLLPHVARIHILYTSGMGDADDMALRQLLSQKMPILDKISANIKTKSRPMGPYNVPAHTRIDGLHTPEEAFVWDLRPEQFPALRELYLGTGIMLLDSFPIFPALKRLELVELRHGSMDIVQFARLLAQLTELEELCIYRFRPTITNVQSPMTLPPSLRKLSVQDNAYYTAPFLASFHIPAHVDLKIARLRDYMDLGDFPENGWELTPFVHDALPSDVGTLPIIKDVTSLEVRHYMMSTYSLRGATPAGHTVRLTGHLMEDWPREYKDLHSFLELVEVFGDADICTLFLNGNNCTEIDADDWEEALSTWPGLERITIAQTDSLTRFDARLSLLDALLPPEFAEGEDPEDTMPVPWLKILTITSLAFRQEDVELAEALASCLKERKDAGFPLHRLHIKLEYIARPDAENECKKKNKWRVRMYSKALKHLVKHLKLELVNDFYPKERPLDDED
ncbi:uncharacterized protein TRAVEDRAFT_24040 [Trametes versicolor FP-101664 SS1]|uniref:uncharacterized protein n=1 Tax=Trametes versicolor (strain FP-101664) TaxID=717944 RepID=UPI0004623A02|nr:uncharacterized protein TRAVEDRAFT_24040 [Trametes versicolor FP-101664 SS1]EIW52531.1 hypothetical protein TRAVEDRAFT_24040 [Trametes versicolor FP-101664 SS1]